MKKLKVGQRVVNAQSGRVGVVREVKDWYVVVKPVGSNLDSAWSFEMLKAVK